MNITAEDTARTYLEKMLAILDIEAVVYEENVDESTTCLRIDCKASDAKLLIGRKGQTLEALQFLLRQMCRGASGEQQHFMIDVLNYRQRRREQIMEQAKEGAVAVLNGETEEYDLQPMSAFERRTVHKYLQEHFPELSSDSRGQGEERHIVISYVGISESEEDREYGGQVEDEELVGEREGGSVS
jgi:spoIIIJ-associated protein